MGDIKTITIPASVTYIGDNAIGYYPPEHDNPFVPSEVIPNFIIYGTSGTEAHTYAEKNGIQFNSVAMGTTVKGTAKSYLSESDAVKIQLIKSGAIAYETTVKGNVSDYSTAGVANGTYTMKVSKNAHADREYTVKVSSADATQNVEIFPMGDVNNDGFIIILDATLVQKYLAKVINEDSLALDNADFDSDDIVRINDATAIQKNLQKQIKPNRVYIPLNSAPFLQCEGVFCA